MKVLFCVLVLCSVVGLAVADRKRCFCKAVASEDSNKVFHDFGTITTHRNWLSVGCRRLHACPDECDKKVKDWMCNDQASCRKKTGGKPVVPYYKASVCGEKAGSNVRRCGCTDGPHSDIPKCQFKCFKEATVQTFILCFNKCLTG